MTKCFSSTHNKKAKVTITQSQYQVFKDFLFKDCIAVAERNICKYLYGKDIVELEHGFCSIEYNTIEFIVADILRNESKRLNIIEE